MNTNIQIAIFIGVVCVLILLLLVRSNTETFATNREIGSDCDGSKCSSCASGCCYLGKCTSTDICFGPYNYWEKTKKTTDDGRNPWECGKVGGSDTGTKEKDKPVAEQPKGSTQTKENNEGRGEWYYGLSSMYNIGDYDQNEGFPGYVKCADKAGLLGKANGQFTDQDNLVALSRKHIDNNEAKWCGAKIEIEMIETGRRTITTVLDRMKAIIADIDMTPAVCWALGEPGTTWLKPLRWRLVY